MKIAIASDHGGLNLKENIKEYLVELGHEVDDKGCHTTESVDYPDYALAVSQDVAQGKAERGILVCGTGIGMSITANKVPGIRAALCHDTFSAKATREHNDSNILCMGERVIGSGLARDIVATWLAGSFAGGRHTRRVDKIKATERGC